MLKVKIEYDKEYYCNELIVSHNGKEIRWEHDGMEPEDTTFTRDLSWVADAIEEAYVLGCEDGLGSPGME